ncbi:S-adenosyl-L-methionine-dependent methyltransferase [Obba rivulosa]|uniref:S-adenosyl-L-methionine-dependent methyltransferase n=1 Tax=Obba rivulosa TaxID=1052685 RepID=A0A8E2AXC0_9APHY|nr:S-adenosyl-L-methionine-dependent methyltransferase [Obba rivulosa]
MSQGSKYVLDHSSSVLHFHAGRTAENSAAYLLDHLQPHMHILDVGCGPGSITIDLATRVPQGRAVGIDYTPDPLENARALAAERGVINVAFEQGDALALPYPDGTFDVVHAHIVIQHLPDPVRALREMRRVARPSDYGTMAWFPDAPGLREFHELYQRLARLKGGEPNAGRRLVSWALQAGFARDNITATAGAWYFSTPQERAYWSGPWAEPERMVNSAPGQLALVQGLATQEDLERMAQGWSEWAAMEDGWHGVVLGEIVCRVSI